MRDNIFTLDGYQLEISDGFIRIINSSGSTDIRYQDYFTLKQMSECLQYIINDPKEWDGTWTSTWEHGLTIAVEFDPTEDHANLCISAGTVYITLGMKASILPSLAQFFLDNN